MIIDRKRKVSLKLVLISIVLIMLFTPFYLYHFNDVSLLKTAYPHVASAAHHGRHVVITEKPPVNWSTIKEISSYAKWAIVLSEDWAFYQHEGIDVEQIKIALTEMIGNERYRGASTITQQMVKNVFLSDARTIWRKIHEIILARKVESELSKARILEIYLNVIEFGPSIYGIKSASNHYFKKSPAQLTAREGAFLAMMLPSPKRYYVSFAKKELTLFARKRIAVILDKMRIAKILNTEQYQQELLTRFSWEKN
jgi:monofunctional glycosyltransferase